MSLTRTDENEVLTALYSGLYDDTAPQIFLGRLKARTQADLCRLAIRLPADSQWLAVEESGRLSAPAPLLLPHPPVERMRPGRVYMAGELDEEESAPPHARHMRVGGSEGGDLLISLLRDGDDFAARDSAFLSALAPHLLILLRARTEIERQRRTNAIAQELLSALDTGWLLIDDEARLLDQDATAARLLTQGKIMARATDGRVRFLQLDAAALLENLGAPSARQHCRAGWLSYDPPMQFAIYPLSRWLGERAAGRHLVHFRATTHPERRKKEARLYGDLFHMTPSEAMFTAHLAEGMSIAEAADELGLTIETARNYSKKVYGKTAMSGQVPLLHMLLSGIPPLA